MLHGWRAARALAFVVFVTYVFGTVLALRAGVYTVETGGKFLSVVDGTRPGKLVMRSNNPTKWSISPLSIDGRLVSLAPYSGSSKDAAPGALSYRQASCSSRQVKLSTRGQTSWRLRYHYVKNRKSVYTFVASEKSAANCSRILSGSGQAPSIVSTNRARNTKWKLRLVKYLPLPGPHPGENTPAPVNPQAPLVDWNVSSTTAFFNETVESFDAEDEQNLCLTLLTVANFPNSPKCMVSSVVSMTSAATVLSLRESQQGIFVNATMSYSTSSASEVEQGLRGMENLNSASLEGMASIVAINGTIAVNNSSLSPPPLPSPSPPLPSPPPPPSSPPPPPPPPPPTFVVPATNAAPPTISSVVLKTGAESDTVVVTWSPGAQSVPAASDPSFSVTCVPTGNGCPSNPSYTLSRPAGSTTTDVGSLVSGTAYDCYVIAKNWDGSKVCSTSSSITTASFYLDPNGVTVKCPNAAVGSTGTVNSVTYTKRSRSDLLTLIQGTNWPLLVTSCTSGITDMSNLFDRNGGPSNDRTFNEDISTWDTSAVTTMASMFKDQTYFDQDISSWDVSLVTSLDSAFNGASRFNRDLQSWTLANSGSGTSCNTFADGAVTWIESYGGTINCNTPPLSSSMINAGCGGTLPMFYLAPNGVTVRCPLASVGSTGTVNSVTYTKRDRPQLVALLGSAGTEALLPTSCITGVTDLASIFSIAGTPQVFDSTSFNPDIRSWDTSLVTSFSQTFRAMTAFNQDLSYWDTRSATVMNQMFRGASTFNQNISSWNVANALQMSNMFDGASTFNQDLSSWDASSLETCGSFATSATAWLAAYSGSIAGKTPPLSPSLIAASCGT